MFNLDLKEVNYERIKAWCNEKVPEGETIEYKREFPAKPKLEKTISSMANTYGGIILVGVQADKKLNIPKSIPGIEFEDGLEEKVMGICVRSIYPPVFPDVKPCKFKDENDNGKAVVFIRVYESDRTPHAINNNTNVYIRIKSQTERFEREATEDERDWLKDRRKKASDLRSEIIKKARERYTLQKPPGKQALDSFIEVFIVPKYPVNQLFPLFEFSDMLNKMKENSKEEGFKSDIDRLINDYQSAPNTVYFLESFEGDLPDSRFNLYSEFNIYGLTYQKNSLREVCYSECQDAFDTHFFLLVLYGTLKKAILLCHTIGFCGVVKVGVNIRGLQGKEICKVSKRNYKLREHRWIKSEIQDEFSFNKDMLVHELDQKIDELCLEIYKEFLWDCGARRQLEDQDKLKDVGIDYDLAKNTYNKRGFQ
jgi:hypothetical protein